MKIFSVHTKKFQGCYSGIWSEDLIPHPENEEFFIVTQKKEVEKKYRGENKYKLLDYRSFRFFSTLKVSIMTRILENKQKKEDLFCSHIN